MGLGSTFQTSIIQFSLSDSMPGYWASNQRNPTLNGPLNKEIAAHEWQQKVKHVMMELNSR